MTFSNEWEKLFKRNYYDAVWPFTDLVSYVSRYGNQRKNSFQVLELGCGAGANIPFFISHGCKYYGMDGSRTTIKRLQKKFPNLKSNLVVGDFTKSIPFNKKFNLIVDRSAVTHNSTSDIKCCLEFTFNKLKKNGLYIGLDWFSTLHSDFKKGDKVDPFTKTGIKKGQFAKVGRVHFSDKKHLMVLFKKFQILILEHKMVTTKIPYGNKKLATWNIVAQKVS